MKILITGAAGFIGFHLAKSFLEDGNEVTGIDEINDYYSINLKKQRLIYLQKYQKFEFFKLSLDEINSLKKEFDLVIHLAAQAGIRIKGSKVSNYKRSNIDGFHSMLNYITSHNIKNFIFASSSSVYGSSNNIPFKEDDNQMQPLSTYAETKILNEKEVTKLHNYYQFNSAGLRFFTVYGRFGRPDMAYYKFTKKIDNDEPIVLFNDGDMSRDMTHIDDIIKGIKSCSEYICEQKLGLNEIFNLGNDQPIKTNYLVNFISSSLKKDAEIINRYSSIEVKNTHASIEKSKLILAYKPKIDFNDGMLDFISWYNSNKGY